MSEEKLVPKLRFSGFTDEWKSYKLGEIGLFKNGVNKSKEDFGSGYPFINLEDIFDKDYLLNKEYSLVKVSKKELKEYNLNKGDVLFVRSSVKPSGVGLTTVINENLINTVFSGFIIRFRENKQILDLNFKRYCFNITSFRNSLMSKSTTSANTNINQQSLSKLTINAPCIDEQKKIASFLEIIDKKIELLNKKSEYYIKFKKYLMQQIFTQKLRFNFNDAWKTVKIKDIFDERSEKGFLDLELLSVTLNDGVIKRSEIESKDNSNENKSNYKHVLPGDIVYNSMRMWQGASGVSPYEGIVSPAYTILIPKNVYSKYFGYYFKTNEMVYQFKKYSQGLTSDTWNLKYPLISEIKIKIPSIEEQKEITNVFEIMDEKIKILQNNIDELTTFKKGLLQQMFVVQLILSLLQNKKHI